VGDFDYVLAGIYESLVSGQSISDIAFHAFVLERIESLKLDCAKICFEITETDAITNLSTANAFITCMQKHHIRFSLDAFGSNVLSFEHLKSLSIDYLKIDKQYIKDLINNDIHRATVRYILEVAKATGKLTIAEWVETEEVETLLHEMGVDYVQGFLRHQPVALTDLISKETVSAVID
jgi:EAL domain-containing protein (putative c-di-GMP-specific phosphodiesterase class I)